MAKTKFTRQNLRSDILKKVVIRVDYQGVSGPSEMDAFTAKIKPEWTVYFRQYGLLKNKNFNVNFGKGGLKSFETEIVQIHRFFSSKIGRSSAFMDITDKFACIEVICASPYEGSDAYFDCMARFVKKLVDNVSFLKVIRIGIRKFDYIFSSSPSDIDNMLEGSIWSNYQDVGFTAEKKEYKDFLKLNDGTRINLGRIIEPVKINNEEQYRLTFDADAYRQDEQLNNSDLRNIAVNKQFLLDINKPLFTFFVNTFTEDYLNQFYHG